MACSPTRAFHTWCGLAKSMAIIYKAGPVVLGFVDLDEVLYGLYSFR